MAGFRAFFAGTHARAVGDTRDNGFRTRMSGVEHCMQAGSVADCYVVGKLSNLLVGFS